MRLNPCCSGQWSSTGHKSQSRAVYKVLILVVVDNGLVHYLLNKENLLCVQVLILVVVDNGLVPQVRVNAESNARTVS